MLNIPVFVAEAPALVTYLTELFETLESHIEFIGCIEIHIYGKKDLEAEE